MTLQEVILAIAGFAVIGSLLILTITCLAHIMKERELERTPQYKRTPEQQVAEYEILNDPAFHI